MAGRIKDTQDNRQDTAMSSLRKRPVGFLLFRLDFLIQYINASLYLAEFNFRSHTYTGAALCANEEMALRQLISEFLGLVYFMQREKKYRKFLAPYRLGINNLRMKLGLYPI